jgi:uncharacterized membrane protein YphA (DoxX/SURF4 family)
MSQGGGLVRLWTSAAPWPRPVNAQKERMLNLTLWIVTVLLVVAFSAGGTSLLLMSRERYRSLGESQRWVDDFGDGHLKFIATVKLLGCAGVLLPGALGVATVLTPLSACGMVMFMTGAATTRFRRSEWKLIGPDLFYLSLWAFVAWGRFDLAPL